MAGRALENGGNIALLNLGQPERAADMYKRASDLFMQNMTPDRAAEMLEKSAKYVFPSALFNSGSLYSFMDFQRTINSLFAHFSRC